MYIIIIIGGKVSGVESQRCESRWWEGQWCGKSVVGESVAWRVSGGKVIDVESQWWESQWRGRDSGGESVVGESPWHGKVCGRGDQRISGGESQ